MLMLVGLDDKGKRASAGSDQIKGVGNLLKLDIQRELLVVKQSLLLGLGVLDEGVEGLLLQRHAEEAAVSA